MRRGLICAVLFMSFFAASAQTSFLRDAVARFDRALVSKDTVALNQILHKDLSYGHSNAWIETKKEMISNLKTGRISYSKIKSEGLKWVAEKDWATVRSTADIEYILDGKEGKLKLHVMQFWMKTNKGWQLVARQSAKLE